MDDYDVSLELQQEIEKRKQSDLWKRIEEAAYKWFDGDLSDRRFAEIIFGLTNEEVKQ